MKYDPEKHHRHSIRLKEYDYSQAGAYFVTICAWNRECLLGEIVHGEVQLNDAGQVVQSVWCGLSKRFPTIGLDAFVIMPNHIHGIIIVGAQFIAPQSAVPNCDASSIHRGMINEGTINRAPTLGEIIRTFKAVSTRLIRRNNPTGFVWQRNYYEHIIRNEESLDAIRKYIVENPFRWAEDEENPVNIKR